MILVITTDPKRAVKGDLIVGPDHPVVHGVEKVILMGSFPDLEKKYQGICPIEIINPKKSAGKPDISEP